jgi:hypothetical protein
MALGVAALVVAAGGTAVAVHGKPALLGRHNAATRATTLHFAGGTPLRLTSKSNRPSLTVGRDTTQVPSLNVSAIGGLGPAALGPHTLVFATAGSEQFVVPAGIHHMLVTVRGAGAGGDAPAVASDGGAGSGGGQGGYAQAWSPVKPGAKYDVSVGIGGNPASNGGRAIDGGFSSVSLAGGTSEFPDVAATGGSAGAAPQTCPAASVGGAAGAAQGPGASRVAAGVIGITTTPAQAGFTSTCNGTSATFGAGGGDAGFPGSGGSGGSQSTAPTAGQPGLVIIQLFA